MPDSLAGRLSQLDVELLGHRRSPVGSLVADVDAVVLPVGPHAPQPQAPAPAADAVLAQLAVEDERSLADDVVGAQALADAVEVDLEGRAHVRRDPHDGSDHGLIISARAQDVALAEPDRPRAQRARLALSPLVHAVDPPRPGAGGRFLCLRRVNLGGLLRHAGRAQWHLRRGRGVRRRRPGRRPHDVHRARRPRSRAPCTRHPTRRRSSSTRPGAGTCTSIPTCRPARWPRAQTCACSRPTSWPAACSRPALIHWRCGPVDSQLLEEAYREYVTTSPSYHLLGSADAAVRTLAADGEQALGATITRTRDPQRALREHLPDLDPLDEPSWLDERADHVAGHDLVKTTVGLTRYDLSGYDVAEALVQRRIIIEKAGVNTITLITTFQLADEAIPDTVDALVDILGDKVLPDGARRPVPANPFSAIEDRPVIHPYAARRYAKSIGHEVPLREAIGKVAAEYVEVYPPGIPVILEGFRVSKDAVDYLLEARDSGGSIVARDTSLETLRVL